MRGIRLKPCAPHEHAKTRSRILGGGSLTGKALRLESLIVCSERSLGLPAFDKSGFSIATALFQQRSTLFRSARRLLCLLVGHDYQRARFQKVPCGGPALSHRSSAPYSTGITSTSTRSFCLREPTMMPSTGETSEKSRPVASTM